MLVQFLKGITGTIFNSYEVDDDSSEHDQQQWMDYNDSLVLNSTLLQCTH